MRSRQVACAIGRCLNGCVSMLRDDAMAPVPADFDLLGRLSGSMARARDLEQLVRPLLELLQTVTGLESTYLTSVDASVGVQHVLFARNSRQLQIPEGLDVPWDGTLCKRALEEGCAYTDDVAGRWGDSGDARALGIETYASVPVRNADGSLYGTLCAASASRMPLGDGATQALQMFSQLIGRQVDRERMLEALRGANQALARSALTDATTGLPNRRALIDEMHRHAVGARARIVAFIDLDGFKAINDRHGHDVGDRFLAAIGERLRGALRIGDFVARVGGDEFVVLSTAPCDALDAAIESLRQRLDAATTGRFALDGAGIDYAGPSIGVVAALPGALDDDVLIARADAAMYEVKRRRKRGASR